MFKRKVLLGIILGAGLVAMVSGSCLAQGSSGSVVGTVHDASGAVVPKANVTATNIATGIATKVTTNNSGDYTFPTLPVGVYNIDVTAPTFQRLQVNKIEIHVASTIRQDATLTVGQIDTQINITPTSQLLQTESAEIGQLVDGRQITELPLVDRNIYRLLTLTAGAESGVNTGNAANQFTILGRPTVAGGRAGFTVFRVDGININNQNLPYASFNPSVDAVQEFRSITTLGDASESGDSSVNLVTKSGTNQFHGAVYEFLRNNSLNALPYYHVALPPAPGFQTAKDTLRYNQFGGAIGGPIWKDKTFFFGSVQALRIRTSTQQRLKAPTAAELGGNFNGVDPITGQLFGTPASPYPVQPGTATPYPTNMIPQTSYSNYAKKLIADGAFLTSNCDSCLANPALAVNYIGNAPGVENDTQYFGRIDHHFSDRDQLQGSFLVEPHSYPQTLSPNPITRLGFTNRVYEVNVGETHLFKQNLLNEFHLGYTRNFSGFGQDPGIDAKGSYPFHNTPDSLPSLFPTAIVIGMGTFGNGSLSDATSEIEDSIDLADSVTWTHGKHELKFGFEGIKARFFDVLSINSVMEYLSGLSGLGFTGNAMSDFEVGLPYVGITLQGTGGAPGVRRNIFAGYAQDTWKVLPSLTLNYGLRYEIQGRWRDVDGNLNRLSTLDTSAASKASGGRFLLAGSANYFVPGTGVVNGTGTPLVGNTIVAPEYNDVMPRFGFAWRPFSDNQTAVRGGFGMYYPVQDANRIAMEINSAPFKFVNVLVNFAGLNGSTAPLLDQNLYPLAGVGSAGSEGENPGNRDPRVYEWTLSMDRQLTRQMLFSLEYVGNHGIKLPVAYNINQAPLPTAAQLPALLAAPSTNSSAATARAPYPNVGLSYLQVSNVATSSYQAMNAKLEGRFSNRLNFTAVYTWSKALDIASSEQEAPVDSYNFASSKSYSAFDHPQRFVASWVYELPFGDTLWHLNNRVANGFIKGWETSGQATFEGGAPFSVLVGADTSFRGDVSPNNVFVYANRTGPIQKTNPRSNNGNYLTTANLGAPAFGTLGNGKRNAFHGPGVNNFDLGLMKNVGLYGRFRLQLRAELFNAFNHGQFVEGTQSLYQATINAPVAPSTTPTLTPVVPGTFGKVTQQGSSRIMQIAAKITF